MTEPSSGVLHTDDPERTTTRADGTPVRNYTAEEYAATYAEGEPHRIPPDVIAKAVADATLGGGES